jgi:dephospho-CoA kinase
MFAAHGAYIFSADEIGREMMQPGQAVYAAIVEKFGPAVVRGDKSLDRAALARFAFGERRIEELNAIVHPAVIARQAALIAETAAREPDAVAMVESALIFETKYGGGDGWHTRFDKVILVRASEDIKIARFVARAAEGKTLSNEERQGLEAEGRRRLAQQIDDDRKAAQCDYVLTNDGTTAELQRQVDVLWPLLKAAAHTQA